MNLEGEWRETETARTDRRQSDKLPDKQTDIQSGECPILNCKRGSHRQNWLRKHKICYSGLLSRCSGS